MKGFTLIELMIVVAIVAILVAVAIGPKEHSGVPKASQKVVNVIPCSQ